MHRKIQLVLSLNREVMIYWMKTYKLEYEACVMYHSYKKLTLELIVRGNCEVLILILISLMLLFRLEREERLWINLPWKNYIMVKVMHGTNLSCVRVVGCWQFCPRVTVPSKLYCVRALRALIVLRCPGQPHLGFHPHPLYQAAQSYLLFFKTNS